MTEAEFHEECGMPMGSHALACPGQFISDKQPAGIALPTSAAEWLLLLEWALDGLRNEMSDK